MSAILCGRTVHGQTETNNVELFDKRLEIERFDATF
jgi:hypothetical protein